MVIERAEQLRQAREAAGLTLADVAQRLRLSVRHLQAIEAADWDRLPGAAFTRGALRSYARLISVDVEPLLGQLPSANSPELLRPAPSLEARLPRRGTGLGFRTDSGHRMTRWVVLGCIVLGAGTALVMFPDAWEGLRESVRARQPQVMPAPAEVSPGKADAQAPVQAQPEVGSADSARASAQRMQEASSAQDNAVARSGPAAESASQAGPVARSEPTKPAEAAPANAVVSWPQSLVVTARRDSWVEVRDPNDRILHMGLVRPSSPLTLELRGPATYTVGNSASTVLEFAGQAVNLAVHTQPGTNIAKGSLP